jgi:hypothetical protein
MDMDTNMDKDRATDMNIDDILRPLTNYVGTSIKYFLSNSPKWQV